MRPAGSRGRRNPKDHARESERGPRPSFPLDQVTARVLRSGRAESYVAEGCGQRAAYLIVRREPSVDIYDCVLTGIVPLAPPGGS